VTSSIVSRHGQPAYADPGSFAYAGLVAVFCTMLLVSTIGATKGIQLGPIFTDGGVFVFPLTYVIGDILTEVFGWRAARRVILLGLGLMAISTFVFWLVLISPGAPGYTAQAGFESVFAVVPRILLASLSGYAAGEFLNSLIVVWHKARHFERRMKWRLFSSTLAGQFVDTLTFCLIAGPAIGITGAADLANYTLVGFTLKVGVELALLPWVTTPLIRALKRREPSYRA
jgi:uncharacterized integral membrane protein (TIGR00697 family)